MVKLLIQTKTDIRCLPLSTSILQVVMSERKSFWSIKKSFRDFPGGPVVKTWGCHCQGPRFQPWLRNWGPTSLTVQLTTRIQKPRKKTWWLKKSFGDLLHHRMSSNPHAHPVFPAFQPEGLSSLTDHSAEPAFQPVGWLSFAHTSAWGSSFHWGYSLSRLLISTLISPFLPQVSSGWMGDLGFSVNHFIEFNWLTF